jgi:hypothetical protein
MLSTMGRSVTGPLCIGLLASSLLGCGLSNSEIQRRKLALESDGAELSHSLDTLEERMLGTRSNLHMWQEMARRHGSVSALACSNVSTHTTQMAQTKVNNLRNGMKRRQVAVTSHTQRKSKAKALRN